MSTTTNPLVLAGDELADARSLTLWGMYEDGYAYRDCVLPGASSSAAYGIDPAEHLRATADLTGVLSLGSGYAQMPRDFTREHVATLERLARHELAYLTIMVGEPPEVV